jgi:hypothetical protein
VPIRVYKTQAEISLSICKSKDLTLELNKISVCKFKNKNQTAGL